MSDENLGILRDAVARAMRENRLGLFVGAGVSKCAGLPLWSEVLTRIGLENDLRHVHGALDTPDLALRAELWLAHCGDRRTLAERVRAAVRPHQVRQFALSSAVHAALAALSPAVVATTNYDSLLEIAFEPRARRLAGDAKCAAWRSADGELPLLHVHGHVDHPAELVIARADYLSYPREHAGVCELMGHWLQDYTFLFLGYGAEDEDLATIAEFGRHLDGRFTAQHHALVVGDYDAAAEEAFAAVNARTHFLPRNGRGRVPVLGEFLRSCV